VNANSTVAVVVDGGGEQVVAHVGLHALGSFADRLGLGASLSESVPQPRFRVHDRGKVLVQAMLMLAGGGEACSDIERLRVQPSLFGSVASDSTLYRTIRSIDAAALDGVWEAIAATRAQVWRRSSATTGNAPVILDLDASLVEIHSENKEGTAANYKRGFGFSPMFCFADATGEALAGLLRPGNATANSIADQLAVLDAAIAGFRHGSRLGIAAVTTRPGCGAVSKCGPTRPGAARVSPASSGPATSALRSWPARTRRCRRRSAARPTTSRVGSRRSPKPATNVMALRSRSSAI
jgi:hypothetical protein